MPEIDECKPCADAHPMAGCADVDCEHNCQRWIDKTPDAKTVGEQITDAVLDAIRPIGAIHSRVAHADAASDDDGSGTCAECEVEWPCRTRVALRRAVTARFHKTPDVGVRPVVEGEHSRNCGVLACAACDREVEGE